MQEAVELSLADNVRLEQLLDDGLAAPDKLPREVVVAAKLLHHLDQDVEGQAHLGVSNWCPFQCHSVPNRVVHDGEVGLELCQSSSRVRLYKVVGRSVEVRK